MQPHFLPFRFAALTAAALASPLLPYAQAEESVIKMERVWKDVPLERPVALIIPPDGTNRSFLAQQRGKILILPTDDKGEAKTFLDLTPRKLEAENGLFEEGLLGLAFHPDFKENGLFYVNYSQQNPKRSVVSEFRVSKDDPEKADESTERVLLEVDQPYWNHNSGNLVFGPDGFLYLSFGDGGKSDDARRLAQNLFLFNGKILRIDVNKRDMGDAYGIPADNPFVGQDGVRPEIWAYGLRNPWGLSFDKNGLFWCADVGQGLWEEIDIITKGGNYGWSYREGQSDFANGTKEPLPEGVKLIEPIAVYGRDLGISVTGGFVYEGDGVPALKGKYLYADWGHGNFWALDYDREGGKVISNTIIYKSPEGDSAREDDSETGKKLRIQPTGIYPDADGEIIVLDWNGAAFKVVPASK